MRKKELPAASAGAEKGRETNCAKDKKIASPGWEDGRGSIAFAMTRTDLNYQ